MILQSDAILFLPFIAILVLSLNLLHKPIPPPFPACRVYRLPHPHRTTYDVFLRQQAEVAGVARVQCLVARHEVIVLPEAVTGYQAVTQEHRVALHPEFLPLFPFYRVAVQQHVQ